MSSHPPDSTGQEMAKPRFLLDKLMESGGAQRVALFQYCVRSITVEPLFLFASGEYRLRPSYKGALAIYDMFCAASAPARIRIPEALPPRDLRLASTIEGLRSRLGTAEQPVDGSPPVPSLPPQVGLFELLSSSLRRSPDGPLRDLELHYDPSLPPDRNLRDGRMNASQRFFRDNLWIPLIRPRLVDAGFWQLRTIE